MTAAEFSELYDRLKETVWAAAFARRLDSAAALDIVQEAFCRLWREVQAGVTISQPRAWLLRVARNLAEDLRKSAFHRNGTLPPEAFGSLRSREPSPSADVLTEEQRMLVRRLLLELPPGDRELLTLRYAAGESTETIAEELGISAAAVHMRLSRARQRLAVLMDDQERVCDGQSK